jgi:hypothetical protein
MQIFKNSGVPEVIVSSVQIELHGSVSRQTYLAESGLTIITFENWLRRQYKLLGFKIRI